jgi:hypothetical protein
MYSRSAKRESAERFLAVWDGLKWPDEDLYKEAELTTNQYRFLGILECNLAFPSRPDSDRGRRHATIRLYLIPERIAFTSWSRERPEHYLIGEANTEKQTVKCMVFGVSPGRYRLKAIWNKTAPFADIDQIVYIPHSGDYESMSESVVEIERAVVTDGGTVECSQRVR